MVVDSSCELLYKYKQFIISYNFIKVYRFVKKSSNFGGKTNRNSRHTGIFVQYEKAETALFSNVNFL
jgi:hypothetical protein